MPSKSKAQARFMQAAAHNAAFAKSADIPQVVAREFSDADEAKKERGKRGGTNKMKTRSTMTSMGGRPS